MMPSRTRKSDTALLLLGGSWALLAAAVFWIYAPVFDAPFVFDDGPNIRYNRHLQMKTLTSAALWEAAVGGPSGNRPVAKISFALNYFFHRYRVNGYHLINTSIHFGNGWLLFWLIRLTPGLFALGEDRRRYWIPFWAAALWLVHPLNTQSVSYIVQRMNSMAAMFYLLSMVSYVKGRRSESHAARGVWYATCLTAGLLALGSKENSAMLPVFIFLYEWYFFQDLSLAWLRRKGAHAAVLLGLLTLLGWIYFGSNPLQKLLDGYAYRDFTMGQRVLTQFRAVVYYLGLWLYPHPARLNLDHDFTVSTSWLHPPTTLLSLLTILAMVATAAITARRHRLLSFAIIWYLGNLIIESSVIGIELVFEHRTYLPVMLLCAAAAQALIDKVSPVWFKAGAVSLAALLLAGWTYQRNLVWASDLSLWRDCALKSPLKPRPHNNFGNALARRGDLQEAVSHYREAIRLKPDYARAHYNLAHTLERLEQEPQAVRHYVEALRIRPGYARAHVNLGTLLRRQGRLSEAAAHFRQAIEADPGYAAAHNNLGNVLAQQGELEKAMQHFRTALRLEPGYTKAHNNLGNAQMRAGNTEAAIDHYREALRIDPNYAKALNNLGVALLKRGDIDAAVDLFARAVRIEPDLISARRNLKWTRRRIENARLPEAPARIPR